MEVPQLTETFPAAPKANIKAGSRGGGPSLPQRHAIIGPARPVPEAPEQELMNRVLDGLRKLPGRPAAKPLRQR